jgi:uncharacterized protein YfdQ (DUF2303 family)
MITTETLQQIGQGPAIDAAGHQLAKFDDMLALPNNFTVHDLEKSQPCRRRARGTMTTSSLEHFCDYVKVRAQEGSCVFIDQQKIQATAVLNLGTAGAPGHADDLAIYAPMQTAAYKALLAISGGMPRSQREVAEFLEDWGPDFITARHGEETMPHAQAVAAIRKVTIESLSKSENTQEQLSASRSAFDQVKATSADGKLPTTFVFSCEPYAGFISRSFTLRLAILTSDKAPTLTLRIVKAEQHAEAMAKELTDDMDAVLDVDAAHVLIGGYVAKA